MCDMENPTFHLEGIVKDKNELQDFSGPLSLILMLLSKNKIEIRDIKISEILDQYLEYLAEMERMDLEIASEFVQMASHDGSKILFSFLSDEGYMKLMRYERYGMIVLLVLVVTNVLSNPLYTATQFVFDKLFVFADWGFALVKALYV